MEREYWKVKKWPEYGNNQLTFKELNFSEGKIFENVSFRFYPIAMFRFSGFFKKSQEILKNLLVFLNKGWIFMFKHSIALIFFYLFVFEFHKYNNFL